MDTTQIAIPVIYQVSFWIVIAGATALVIWALTRVYFTVSGEGRSSISRMIKAKNAGIEPKASQAVIESGQRFWIALMVVLLSVGILVFLVILAVTRRSTDTGEIDDLLTVLLPVIGTWVGTVLAFYFARENLQAASTSALEMFQARGGNALESLLVRKIMLPLNRFGEVRIPQGKTEKDVTLDKVDAVIQKGHSRCPILTHDDVAKYVVHKSILYEFVAKNGKTSDPTKLTLLDLVQAHPGIAKIMFVRPNDSLADAKSKLDSAPGCQDVFVTEAADKAKPVLGWITNVDIEGHSKV